MNNIDYEITTDGAFRLAEGILSLTYYDYRDALKHLKKLKKEFEEVSPIVIEYKKWLELKSEALRIKQKKIKKPEDIEKIKKFEETPVPIVPTKKQKTIYSKYWHYYTIARECELFYLSDRYKKFTLGKGLNGAEVIERIKKDVNFKQRMHTIE